MSHPTPSDTVFWIIIAAMVVMLAGLMAFFRRRGWL